MNPRIVTQAEVDALQKRLQRGTTTYDAANNLHAECYGTIGAIACGRLSPVTSRRTVPTMPSS